MTAASALPSTLAVFPLDGALLFPRGVLPLHIFEPRYRQMVRDALAGASMIGMIQPRGTGDPPSLFAIGCVGRIEEVSETPDGRFMLTLAGLHRFRIAEELVVTTPYRQIVADYGGFADGDDPAPLAPAMRAAVEHELAGYLGARSMAADWTAVTDADDESLINSLATACPFETAERQALLEAPTLAERADLLLAFMRFADAGDGQRLQ